MILYFLLPEGHGYIWLIAQRFPILFAMLAIPLVRMPSGIRGWMVTAAAAVLGTLTTVNTCRHFVEFEMKDVGAIDAAIDAIPPNRKVCALIYDRGSSVMNNQPFSFWFVLPGAKGRGRDVYVCGICPLAGRFSTRQISSTRRSRAASLGVDA